ncbi:hypothetical protein BGX31_010453, partial [Mortierella sp. GBA43]
RQVNTNVGDIVNDTLEKTNGLAGGAAGLVPKGTVPTLTKRQVNTNVGDIVNDTLEKTNGLAGGAAGLVPKGTVPPVSK